MSNELIWEMEYLGTCDEEEVEDEEEPEI